MDNERKVGAGRAVEEAAENIERRDSDMDTIGEEARGAGQALAGAGPEMSRHIARENPQSAFGDEDEMADSDTVMDEDDEDEDDLDEEHEDEDEDVGVEAMDEAQGTPGYGDRGNTPI